MKLNLDFYKSESNQISDIERKCIEEYIDIYNNEKYENNINSEAITDDKLYYLSTSSQNLISWYQFDKNDTLLEIDGDLGERTQVYCDKCKRVVTIEKNIDKAKAIAKRYSNRENLEVIVGDIENISIDEKFSIIAIIGTKRKQKLKELIKKLEKNLADGGKFIIAVDNKFGLRYFMGNPENILNKKFVSLIGYNNEEEKIESFSKNKLKKLFDSLNYNTTFYYPLPDYRIPNVIFSDMQIAQYNNVDKYMPYCKENSTIIANEIDVYREILKSDPEMFSFFANSFLVILSKNKIHDMPIYISFNNIRKEKYRLITKINKDKVKKQIVSYEAKKHYENVKKNIKRMQENNILTVDYIENGYINSKYINQDKMLSLILTKCLEENNIAEFEKIITKYLSELRKNKEVSVNYVDTIFAKYNVKVNEKDIKEMNFIKDGFWDMTFKNCFFFDNKFYFFDQEWLEENVPIEYILYRAILYTISLRRFINIDELFKKYNIEKYRNVFDELDNKLQEEIKSDKIWKFYNKNKYVDIDATIQELKNVQIRDNAKQQAIEQLLKEKEQIINEKCEVQNELNKACEVNNELLNKYQTLEKLYNEKLYSKIYRKIKRIIYKKGEKQK